MIKITPRLLVFSVTVMLTPALSAQVPGAQRVTPNLESNIDHPLRYRPDGEDFVIENGPEFFNRPLYGGNTAFRVDGGDKPEFVLYLPGRGGNLRLAVRSGSGAKWLHDAAQIVTRYRPGSLLYEIRDPLLGANGVLQLTVLSYDQVEGLVVRAAASGLPPGLEFIWAYGGVNGQRGSRDGDIGTERVPISEWFQLQPEFCRGNAIEIEGDAFKLRAKPTTISGLAPAGARLEVRDAAQWNNLAALISTTSGQSGTQPILVGRVPLANGQPLLLSLQSLPTGAGIPDLATYKEVGAPQDQRQPSAPVPVYRREELPQRFTETEAHFATLRHRVSIETPDPFLNAAVGALNVAADAVWDESEHAIMHGAIAWRTKLLGWRGPYVLDALGWAERARSHFEYWSGRQNGTPIPAQLPPADESSNLARNETGLHSNGDISNSHYDMNLVFIDALFRHLRWTGDLEFAKKVWPVIERHLAWERRLFRREFTSASGEKLPLYEAYAVIWASDDLQYSGGGTAHGSAYNYLHNTIAARVASLIGADPTPYAREAELIARGMRELLWVGHTGMFAESKDWLGRQMVHPDAAVWSFYHVMDAELVTPAEAQRMTAYVEHRIPAIPVRGPGVPAGLVTLSTSNWMPYTWSINNVCMNENAHTALGLWQGGAPDEAFRVLKGSVLAAMFMGISPGNVGTMSYLDVYRRESQRDFADGSGMLSRALVEGLFGVRPDLLTGQLVVAPGFPADWPQASLHHPQLDLQYHHETTRDRWTITSRLARQVPLLLRLPARGATASVTVNGSTMTLPVNAATGLLEIHGPASATYAISVDWQGVRPATNTVPLPSPPSEEMRFASRAPAPGARWDSVDLSRAFNDRVTEIFRKGKYRSPRSPFVSLAQPTQGLGYWAGHVDSMAQIDDSGLRAVASRNGGRLTLPNGIIFATPGSGDERNVLFTSQWDNYPRDATVPLTGKARGLQLLMAGSTNAMQSHLDNGEVVVTYTDGTVSRLPLRNPETWWPIEQDYFIDDYQFRLEGPLPTRVDLRTGTVRALDAATFKGRGREIPGGAATVLSLSLDSAKELRSLTVRALANDVVIGLMAATLER